MDKAAFFTLKRHRDHLARFRVVTKACRVRHPDEFVFDNRFGEFKRSRDYCAQGVGISPVGNNQKLPVNEPVWPARIGGAGQGHREGFAAYVVGVHGNSPVRPWIA